MHGDRTTQPLTDWDGVYCILAPRYVMAHTRRDSYALWARQIPEYDSGVIRLHNREDGPLDLSDGLHARMAAAHHAAAEASGAGGEGSSSSSSGGTGSSDDKGGLRRSSDTDETASAGLEAHEVRRRMMLGRSPISGNAVTLRGGSWNS